MKRTLLAAAALLALSATVSNAKDLPECNGDQVQQTFNNGQTRALISPKSDFFHYFSTPTPPPEPTTTTSPAAKAD